MTPDDHRPTPTNFADAIRARVRPGLGDKVLWIHGYTLDATTWEPLWSLLPEWSHYGIDLPGHGASAALRPRTTLADLGRQLADTAADCGVRHVVGLSLGSMIALEVATSHPDAFATLTLAAPTIAGGPVAWDVGRRYRELSELYQRRGAGPWMTELWMRCPPATFAHATPAVRAQLAAVIDRHAWSELGDPGFGVAGLARDAQDTRRLARSAARQLYVIGEHEIPAFRQAAAMLGAIRPDARLAELPGAGHLCLLHTPEPAARLLAEFWSTPGEGGHAPSPES